VVTRTPIAAKFPQQKPAAGPRPPPRQGGAGQGSAGASRWNAGGGAARPGPRSPSGKVVARQESAPSRPPTGMQLRTIDGARKYLTASERDLFLKAAERGDRDARTLCMTLTYAGCRLSEALALTADRVDLAAGVLVFESLKKRRAGIYRAVPVPPALLETLDMVHGIRELQGKRGKGRDMRLWPWSRMTAWRQVHAVMDGAGLSGPHASPKGLRHGFGVAAVSAGIPLNLVQKWLGHAQLSTTAIYANAVGAEEKDIAQRMWR
jgi:integrase/recombinase XerD